MTALCGGGSSQPKPWLNSLVYLTTAAIASRLNNLGGAWATVAAPLIGLLTLNLDSFCATDPPEDQELTSAEYDALLKLTIGGDLTSAIGKLKDKVLIAIWYEMCECVSVATPSLPPEILAPPAGVYVPGPVAAGNCARGVYAEDPGYWDGSTPAFGETWVHTPLFPGLPTFESSANATITAASPVVDVSGWQNYRIYGQARGQVNSTLVAYPVYLWFFTAAGAITSNTFMIPQWSTTLDAPDTLEGAVPATSRYMAIGVYRSTTTANGHLYLDAEGFCGDQYSAASTAPCATDPAVLALLEQLLSMVTLIQRQHVPFAQVSGTAHTGLTGTGVLNVSAIIGVSIEITARPTYLGVEEGSPDRIFDVGYVSKGTADGWCCTERIPSDTYFYRCDGDITRIGYALSPGVTATITEKLREP